MKTRGTEEDRIYHSTLNNLNCSPLFLLFQSDVKLVMYEFAWEWEAADRTKMKSELLHHNNAFITRL